MQPPESRISAGGESCALITCPCVCGLRCGFNTEHVSDGQRAVSRRAVRECVFLINTLRVAPELLLILLSMGRGERRGRGDEELTSIQVLMSTYAAHPSRSAYTEVNTQYTHSGKLIYISCFLKKMPHAIR